MMPDIGRPAAGGRSDSVNALGTMPATSLDLSDSMPALGIMAICAVCRRRRHYAAAAAAAAAVVWPGIYSSINDAYIESEALRLIGRILGRPEPHPDGYGRGRAWSDSRWRLWGRTLGG